MSLIGILIIRLFNAIFRNNLMSGLKSVVFIANSFKKSKVIDLISII
jgi:hypothetical protein